MAAFVQHTRKPVALMFYRGGAIPGRYESLEGQGRAVRFIRFADPADLEAKRDDLRRIAVAWCGLVDRG